MDGPAHDADDSAATTAGRRSPLLTPAGVAAVVAGLALVLLAPAAPLRWLGAAFVALGVALVGTPLSAPSGTGEEDPFAVTLPDGRPGSAFAWSRFAPSMTVVVLLASVCFLVGLGLVFVSIGLLAVAVFFAIFAALLLGRAVRFVPALRDRRLVITAEGVIVVLRGQSAELPWATITAVDVASPAAPVAEMGGAITLRTLEHEVPGSPELSRRLTSLARPYGGGADIALPVAGLRHDPGALLVALERGRPGSGP